MGQSFRQVEDIHSPADLQRFKQVRRANYRLMLHSTMPSVGAVDLIPKKWLAVTDHLLFRGRYRTSISISQAHLLALENCRDHHPDGLTLLITKASSQMTPRTDMRRRERNVSLLHFTKQRGHSPLLRVAELDLNSQGRRERPGDPLPQLYGSLSKASRGVMSCGTTGP
jgi:hypothetical protein